MDTALHVRPAPQAATTTLRLGEGVSLHADAEAAVAAAEEAVERSAHADAVAILAEARPLLGLEAPEALLVRALQAESWARMSLGELDAAVALVQRARVIVERASFTDVDRAEALYRLGCCRVKASQISSAVELFTHALGLCDRTSLPCDRLRARIYEWRSRCYQRQRDLEAARADVERALELAEGLGDRQTVAHVYFQASLVAERTKQWLLARFYAEEARTIYETCGDLPGVARLLNNLGAIDHLLGEDDEAVAHLKRSFEVARDAGLEAEAAQAVSSLAQVQLARGERGPAERNARRAIELLQERPDFRDELGNALLVLGRTLLEEGRHDEAEEAFARAEESLVAIESPSHAAAVWVAQGDLARARGDADAAAERYREAALSLQDLHF